MKLESRQFLDIIGFQCSEKHCFLRLMFFRNQLIVSCFSSNHMYSEVKFIFELMFLFANCFPHTESALQEIRQ